MRVYISGKISNGDLEKTTPVDRAVIRRKFDEAAKLFSDEGHTVVNPMRLPHEHSCEWENYLAEDLDELSGCDAIYMLPDWQDSLGARLEHAYAARKGIHIMYAPSIQVVRKTSHTLPNEEGHINLFWGAVAATAALFVIFAYVLIRVTS